MLNIFNLFLFLLVIWIILMISSNHFTAIYLFFGIISAISISFAAKNLKLIDKTSEFLYLSLGFYRHFIKLYFKNLFKALNLIIDIALTNKPLRPLVYSINLDYENRFNPALMITSINMSAGLFCISMKENKFIIHALDEKYYAYFNLFKINKDLPQVNDDNLV